MGTEPKICPSCQEKNNPDFDVCWSCNVNFRTGEFVKKVAVTGKPWEANEKDKAWLSILGICVVLIGFLGDFLSIFLTGIPNPLLATISCSIVFWKLTRRKIFVILPTILSIALGIFIFKTQF